LIGCADAEGFYKKHGLAVDGSAPAAQSSPAKSASKTPAASSPKSAVADNTASAEAASPAASPIKASPSSPGAAAAAPAGESNAEDSFAFEGEERAPAQQLDNTFAESEKDPYNDTFDAEGEQSPEGGGSPASPGLSPNNAAGQYSQDDFEMEADRSPAKGEQPNVNPDYTAEFEDADFEQESPPPTAPAAGEESNDAGFEGTRQSMEDFEDDELKRNNSKYSTGEFEFEADESEAKGADKPKAQDNDDGDFEADDDDDFEDDG